MIINITLIVQMLHFAVAYYMLKIILLRPAVARVLAKDAAEKKLQLLVHDQQKKLSHREWVELRRLLRAESPLLKKFSIPYSTPPMPMGHILMDENQLRVMTQEVKDALITRLSRY